jgi:Icc-related predicted phosphoesterase
VLCGHIHQSPWATGGSWHARLGDTWVFNAGKQIGPVPAHITLDTEAATADWFGVYESETLTLA